MARIISGVSHRVAMRSRPLANDITFVAITTGFVYVAIIMDAWSRRIVGYAIGRRIDARLAVAAFERAIALRRPLPGCVFHTDRGSQGCLNRSSQHGQLLRSRRPRPVPPPGFSTRASCGVAR
ncbi:DDE-type integrase/transposase/recombinase [Palleronia aestuarii]|uniref:DDE-type integrase/transposase/recombinase n=1 Tax=Palleronia aestuarii TaxID=568105 RepID=UPI000DAE0308